MGIQYQSLNANVRNHMDSELKSDIANGKIYLSPRLNNGYEDRWKDILKQAVTSQSDDWLAGKIREQGLLRAQEQRKTKNGSTMTNVPNNAPEMLAEGEFNRPYCRGVCLEAIQNGEDSVEVYRGKNVSSPRPESEALIGQRISAKKLLEDLRANHTDTALGLPPGPNSGLTIKRIGD